MIRKLALAGAVVSAFAVLAAFFSPAEAQSNCPYIRQGAVLTPGQWNQCFAAKNDVLSYTPVNRAGDTMTGRLVTTASTTSNAGFSILPGTAPTSPVNGDLWTTTAGLFARINGSTVGPFVSSATVALAANTTPITGCTSGGIMFVNSGTVSCTDTIGSANLTTSGKLSILLPDATVAQALVIGTQSGSSFTPTPGPYNAIEVNSTWTTSLSGGGGPGGPETMHTMHINLYVGGAAYGAQSVAAFSGVLHHVLDIPAGGHSAGGDLTAIGGFINSTAAAPGRHMYSLTGGVRCDTGCSAIAILGQENDMFLVGSGSVNYVIGYNSWIGSTTAAGVFSAAYSIGASGPPGGGIIPWDKGFVLFTEAGATNAPISTTGDLFYADTAMTLRNIFNMPTMTVTGSILLFPNVDITGAGVGRFGSATSAGGLEIAGGALDNMALTYAFNSVEKFQIGSTATVAYWTKVGAGTSAISIDFTTNKPTLNNGVTITTAFDAAGLVKNVDLVNTTITVNGTTCTLGSTCSPTASASTVTPGTTTVSGATAPCILINSAGTTLACSSILTAPTINGGTHTAITSLGIRSTGAAFDLTIASTEVFTAGRTLTITLNDAARTMNLGGNITTAGAFTTSGAFGITFTATGTTTLTLPTSGTLATLSGSETLANKTLTSPTINGGTHTAITSLGLRSSGTGAFDLTLANTENLTAGRTLTLTVNDAARTINLGGNLTLAGAFTTAGAFAVTATFTNTTTITFPTSGTLATLAGSEAFTNKTYNGNTWTAGTGTLTIAAGKTATHNATTTFAGTDGKTLTISNSGTLSGGDAFVLSIAANKTLTVSNSITFTATDGSTLAIGTGGTLGTAAYQSTGTSGATIPFLNGANAWSADQTISKANPQLSISKAASGQDTIIAGQTAGVNRWVIDIGNSTAESGNAGSNFGINRYNDAGTFQATPFTIARLDGATTIGEATSAAIVSILSTNTATSKTTGALRVSGGLGVAGATFTDTLSVITMANTATTSAVCYNTSTGLLTYNGASGTCTVSVLAAKNLVAPLTDKDGFDIVMGMVPWRYDMKPDLPTYVPGEQIGFVAEYTKEDRVVARNADGSPSGIRYEQYTAALTAAFKYLKADNDNLRLEVETLKAARR